MITAEEKQERRAAPVTFMSLLPRKANQPGFLVAGGRPFLSVFSPARAAGRVAPALVQTGL